MKKTRIAQWAFVGTAVWLIGSCTSQKVRREGEAIQTALSILYQASRYGEMEPCGCQSTPYGGIDREYNLITQMKGDLKGALYLDAGNALAPLKLEAGIDHHREKAKMLVQMMGELGVNVFAPGPVDYRLGKDFLRGLSSPFSWISTNVVEEKTGKPVFKPYVIVEREGVRIAVLSATPQTLTEESLRVLPPEKSLESALKELEGKADMRVLLSQLSHSDNERLAETGKFHLIVGGDHATIAEDPFWYHGQTLLLDSFDRGYRLGRLDLDLKLPFKGFFDPGQVFRNASRLRHLEKQKQTAQVKAQIAKLKETGYLSVIEGGTRYLHALLKPNEKEHGGPNKLSQMKEAYRAQLRKRALAE